jgi:hypothetical protein
LSLNICKKSDSSQQSLFIDEFRIFPYMNMLGGAHHGASYQWAWDPTAGEYKLYDFSLTQMEGCWSLRWTLDEEDQVSTSQKLVDISEYSNNSPEENFEAATLCSRCSEISTSDEPANLEHQH